MTSPVTASSGRVVVRGLRPSDWAAVASIYAEGIETRNATFETELPTWDAWDRAHLAEPRLVAELDGAVVGWAAVSPESERCVYAGVVEDSVYVAESARGRGIGRELLTRLVEATDRAGIWTIQAGVFPENEESLALHCACGFRLVGRRERIGSLDGAWRDVLLLERRSTAI